MSTERPRRRARGWGKARVFTVGHSTRPAVELVELLRAYGIRTLVDIRTVPRSRKNPQYNKDVLEGTLAEVGIHYVHLPRLGGLRHARKDSPNTAWRNASFRGYADYMGTEDFAHGLEALRALTPDGPLALMCAEAVPWRCHRSLLADALVARGVEVRHIMDARSEPHRLTRFAVVRDGRVEYPPEAGETTTTQEDLFR